MSFQIYTDAALTTPLSGNLIFEEPSDHSQSPSDIQLFIGSTDTGKKVNATSDPGIDQIAVSITDTAPGADHEAAEIKLATTEAGLASATGGVALNLGTQILSLAANAAEFWVRSRDATGTQGTATELGIETNALSEFDQ